MHPTYEIWMHGKTKMVVHRSESHTRAKRMARHFTRLAQGLIPPVRYTVRIIQPTRK